ncbi:Trafficking protein particle complex subunit 1, partial [Atta colombica]
NSQLCPAVLDIVETSKQLLQSQRCKTKERQRASVMTIHNLYIFSKTGTLLYYAEWNRLNKSGITKEEEAKLMYGMLFSIKSFVSKISPLDPKEGFLYYKTSKYTLHYFETPSGLKFVLNTDNASQNARELLQQLYREVYLEYVVKNPLCQLNEPIQSELFKMKVDELFKKSPLFLSRSL